MALNLSEIFYSIQGESLFAGLPCVFVRLSGCNLRCAYCDTRYAREDGFPMSSDEMLPMVARYRCPLVEITGGEPLIQEETPELARKLLDAGYTVLMETNGSLDIDRVDRRCVRIMDIKCPGSGESDKNDLENLNRLTPRDQLKFVLMDKADYDFAVRLLHSTWSSPFPVPVLFSAAAPHLFPARLAEWMLRDHLDVRLQVQVHKILWPQEERGR